MNKRQKLCIVALFFSYYLISKIFPFNIAMFSKSGLLLGLVFPFIEKRTRILITTVYQGLSAYTMFNLLKTGAPTIGALFDNALKSSAPTTTSFVSDGIISNTESIIIVLYALYPHILGVIKFSTGVLVMFSILTLIYNTLSLVGAFTEPYSCYWLYKKLGLFNLIERHTGGRIIIDDR